jgi:hypothetical protein
MKPTGKFPFWNQPPARRIANERQSPIAKAARPTAMGDRPLAIPRKMQRIFRVGQLRAGAPRRLPGYMQECLKRGQIDPSIKIINDQTLISFTERDFQEIRQQFNPKTGVQHLKPGCCGG